MTVDIETFDPDLLNEQARVLYDEAFRRGQRKGEDAKSHELALEHGERLLDIARRVAEGAVSWPRDTAESRRQQGQQVAIVRMILRRTPLSVGYEWLDKALFLVKKPAFRTPDGSVRDAADVALLARYVREAHEHTARAQIARREREWSA